MLERDFRWKGTLASEMGVIVTKQVQYRRPVKRVNIYTVPGRSGALVGRDPDAYDEALYAPDCAILPGANRQEVFSWLMGAGEVEFGSMQDFVFAARISDAFDASALVEGAGNGYLLFTPVFICHPERRSSLPEGRIHISSEERMEINPGNVPAAPLVTIRASGADEVTIRLTDTEKTFSATLRLGGPTDGLLWDAAQMTLTGLPEGGCEIIAGEPDTVFPRIAPGKWLASITAAGGAEVSMEIQPRYRWV